MITLTFTGERKPIARISVTMAEDGKVVSIKGVPFVTSKRVRAEAVYSKLGFDWGTENDSTIELARTLLRRVYPPSYSFVLNDTMYRKFATEVVSKFPREKFSLTDTEIQGWVSGS